MLLCHLNYQFGITLLSPGTDVNAAMLLSTWQLKVVWLLMWNKNEFVFLIINERGVVVFHFPPKTKLNWGTDQSMILVRCDTPIKYYCL